MGAAKTKTFTLPTQGVREESALGATSQCNSDSYQDATSTGVAEHCEDEDSLRQWPIHSFAEVPAFIDEKTAALIQHEQWASAVQARLEKDGANLGDSSCGAAPPTRNTFIHYPDRDLSPRTVQTS